MYVALNPIIYMALRSVCCARIGLERAVRQCRGRVEESTERINRGYEAQRAQV